MVELHVGGRPPRDIRLPLGLAEPAALPRGRRRRDQPPLAARPPGGPSAPSEVDLGHRSRPAAGPFLVRSLAGPDRGGIVRSRRNDGLEELALGSRRPVGADCGASGVPRGGRRRWRCCVRRGGSRGRRSSAAPGGDGGRRERPLRRCRARWPPDPWPLQGQPMARRRPRPRVSRRRERCAGTSRP